MLDVYSQEITRLADSMKSYVYASWKSGGPLFQIASLSGSWRNVDHGEDGGRCGCLTMIRGHHCCASSAATIALQLEIQKDVRIPLSEVDLLDRWDEISAAQRISRLQPFAEWQRRLDIEIRGKVPAEQPVESVAS